MDLPAPFSPHRAWTVPLDTVMSMSRLATTPGKRLVMPRSSTAAGGLDALMAHSPRGKGLRRGGRAGVGDASAATPSYTRRVDTLLWLGEGAANDSPAPSRGPVGGPDPCGPTGPVDGRTPTGRSGQLKGWS
ncbi:hypothetical protein SGPA1_12310 [Streptomyces misionensis JCM 4497]